MVTYAAFSKVGEANPISYDDFTTHLISKFRQTGAVFARKFSPAAVDLSKWTNVMQSLTSASASASLGKGISGAAATGLAMSSPRATFPIAVASAAAAAPSAAADGSVAQNDLSTKHKHEAAAGAKTAPPSRLSGFPLSVPPSAQTQLHTPLVSVTTAKAEAATQETGEDPVLKKARREES
jgi:hypothetical protein